MDEAMEATVLPEIDVREFIKVVESRRSVRRFTDEPVPETIVNQCLDLAMLAPNSCNLQPWEFYWIKTDSVREKIIEACLGQNAARTSQQLIAVVARTGTWREHCVEQLRQWPDSKVPKIIDRFYRRVAPFQYAQGPFSLFGYAKKALYAVVGLKRAVPRGPYSHREMREWAVKSTALAAENLMLAFRAFGYDTCPMEGFDAVRAKRALKLPKDAEIVMFVAAGKRAENGIYNSRLRFERERFIREV
ncbi:MAG: nitroreductase family protein [Alcanivoracaceae bacterium]|nr:nitroreductase family protein [Alcanivoracaceae bacterium]